MYKVLRKQKFTKIIAALVLTCLAPAAQADIAQARAAFLQKKLWSGVTAGRCGTGRDPV